MRVNLQLLIAQSVGVFLALVLALFLPAGTLTWLVGWLYLVLFFGGYMGLNA
jgi:FtsH-binding integral membrane protein